MRSYETRFGNNSQPTKNPWSFNDKELVDFERFVSSYGFNSIKRKMMKNHDNKIYIEMIKYAEIIMDELIKSKKFSIYNDLELFEDEDIWEKIYEHKEYITPNDDNFQIVINYKFYSGMVYRIVNKISLPNNLFNDKGYKWYKGKMYGGFSKLLMDERLKYHIERSIRQCFEYRENVRKSLPVKLKRVIIASLEEAYAKNKINLNMNELYNLFFKSNRLEEQKRVMTLLIDILKSCYLDIEVIEVHKNINSALESEKSFIEDNNLVQEGLNERSGGAHGRKTNTIPLYDVAGMIALGYNIKGITKVLNKYYKGSWSEETVRRQIFNFFGSWDEIQVEFLKPVVEGLVYERFSYKEIYNKLGSYLESKGWVYSWWMGEEKLDYKFWKEHPEYLDIEKINKIIKNTDKVICGIELDKLARLILEKKTNVQIAREFKVSEYDVRIVMKILGGKVNFIKKYRKLKTKELRKLGWSLKNIYIKVFGLKSFGNHGARDFEKWFDGWSLKKIEEKYSPKKNTNYLG